MLGIAKRWHKVDVKSDGPAGSTTRHQSGQNDNREDAKEGKEGNNDAGEKVEKREVDVDDEKAKEATDARQRPVDLERTSSGSWIQKLSSMITGSPDKVGKQDESTKEDAAADGQN